MDNLSNVGSGNASSEAVYRRGQSQRKEWQARREGGHPSRHLQQCNWKTWQPMSDFLSRIVGGNPTMSHVDSFVKRSSLYYNINRTQNAIKECQFSSKILSRTILSSSTQTAPHRTWQIQHVCSCIHCLCVGSPSLCDCQHPSSHWRSLQPVQHWVHILLQFGCGCK